MQRSSGKQESTGSKPRQWITWSPQEIRFYYLIIIIESAAQRDYLSLKICFSCLPRKVMMELHFCNVKLGYESRPRTSSHKISVAVGAVSLYDHCTPDSAFPVLISPQSKLHYLFPLTASGRHGGVEPLTHTF